MTGFHSEIEFRMTIWGFVMPYGVQVCDSYVEPRDPETEAHNAALTWPKHAGRSHRPVTP